MNPETLETIGLWDFDGQLPSLTFTAHPKFDPLTREMLCFGYEARGDGTPDVCYWTVKPDGKFGETVWMVAPICGMMHDFAVTKNYVLFPMMPYTCDVERLKRGGEHWQWDGTSPMYIGVLPRRGSSGSDIKVSRRMTPLTCMVPMLSTADNLFSSGSELLTASLVASATPMKTLQAELS